MKLDLMTIKPSGAGTFNQSSQISPESSRMHLAKSILFLVVTHWVATAASASSPENAVRGGQLAEGTRWETPWFEIDSGVDGPVLLITAGIHGNEPAGYRAAEQIRNWPIRRGRLIVVPRVNKLGLAANTRWLPSFRDDKNLRDANRNFPKKNDQDAARTILCRELWRFTQRHKPSCVVDLHEGFDFHIANSKSVGSSIIFRDSKLNKPHVVAMQNAVNATIADPERRFVRLGKTGPVEGSLVRSAIDRLGCNGFILETTFKDQPLSLRVRQHRMMVATLMRRLQMIDDECVDRLAPMSHGKVRHIVLYDGKGTGAAGVATLTKIFDQDPRFVVHRVGSADLRSASLDQFAMLVFPGGSGSRQAAAIGVAAKDKVRGFVRDGGGYLGICAGAYLCSAHYDWSLNLVDTRVFTGSREIPEVGRKQMWHRGPSATVKMELTDEGRKILGDWQGDVAVRYHNGPIVSPAGRPDLPTYLPLAHFRSEVAAWEPQQGTMINTPAIVAGRFGKGRVISISPHPESSGKVQSIINRAAAWVIGIAGETTPANESLEGSQVQAK